MRINQILYIIFFAALLSGCDDRYQILEEFNSAPSIRLVAQTPGKNAVLDKNGDIISDSVKMSGSGNYYPFTVVVDDPDRNIGDVYYVAESGSGDLIVYTDTVSENAVIPLIDYSMTLKFKPTTEGQVKLLFHVTDRQHLSDTATLTLTTFKNLPPIGSLNPSYVGESSPYEYNIDASGSYDADHDFGGYIKEYIYNIDNEVIKTTRKSIKYIFPSPGTYNVQLQVKDNDDVLSTIISKQIIVANN